MPETRDPIAARFDARVDGIIEALVEQRKYIELAFDTLRREMMGEITAGFGRIDRKLDRVLDILPRPPAAPRRRRS